MGGAEQCLVVVGERARLGHVAGAVLRDHRQHALGQVAEVVGEVVVDAADHGGVAEVAVIAEGDLAQEEVAGLVEAVALDQLQGGLTTLPRDFDIFWPSTVHQPWAKTRLGGSRPALIRKAGQ